VLRRLRRPAAALTAVLLLAPALAACGSSAKKDADATSDAGLEAVSITGDVGKGLKATWHKKVASPKAPTATTLVKGTGSKIASGDSVSTYLWIGNGTTKKAAYSDYDNGAPETVPNSGQLNEVFTKLFEDATYGSRVAVVTTASDLLGSTSGNPQLGIGPDDNLVVVADLVKKAPVSPQPSDDKAHDAPPASLPKVVLKKGEPVGLDWAGIAKPALTKPVQRVVLKKGTGPVVKASDTVTVNYLGETYKAKSPFESSFTSKPFTKPLNSLVQGWQIGLTGVKVGSRVLLEIPPAYGYGAEGSGSTIPGNATLWFVIDVVKAK
jgi:peptidylprolyl isomerase